MVWIFGVWGMVPKIRRKKHADGTEYMGLTENFNASMLRPPGGANELLGRTFSR
jgi:hypothetical protein